MAKVKKHAEMLKGLMELVQTKEAALAQTNISGEPGKDTNFTSISDETETTNQNAVGPEELNGKQGPEQHPAEADPAIPVDTAKQASADIGKVAASILEEIRGSLNKSAKAQTDISGVPGKDTKITSVSTETETTNQNAVGPEELNGKQGPEQEASNDPDAPVKSAAMGKAFFTALTKRAAEIKASQAQENHYLMCKAAGRADLETLVQHAVQQLEVQKQAEEAYIAAEAEKQGAALFDEMYKQASYEKALADQAAEIEALKEKVASFQAVQTAPTQTEAEKIASLVADVLEKRLKSA